MPFVRRHPRLTPFAICLLIAATATASGNAADDVDAAAVAITAQFPGGNIKVEQIDGKTAHISPDRRGDRPWFYWCFEATATKAGRVNFVFPTKVAGFTNGAIGYQGPAISTNGGTSWRWMGTRTVKDNTFHYEFENKGDRVRFAVTIPYVESDLTKFLKQHGNNKHLQSGVLTQSRKGRDVELLQIGTPGPNKTPVLITARHHATETIASYVVEGVLQEAMSNSTSGESFRKKYVLFAVPFVDKDGVEAGDQGKNRKPHDHNRDYGEKSIYPEVRAIKQLHAAHRFRFALDFHCPTLVMKDHQVMYFVGAKVNPPHNFENVATFAERIKNDLPKSAPVGPLVWLRDKDRPAPMNSTYFGNQPGVIMAATLEVPFAPPGKATDPASCRNYGKVILQAFTETTFRTAQNE